MQHLEQNRFDSYRPAFLLGGLVSAQRTPSVVIKAERLVGPQIIKTKGSQSSLRLWFKSKVSRSIAS